MAAGYWAGQKPHQAGLVHVTPPFFLHQPIPPSSTIKASQREASKPVNKTNFNNDFFVTLLRLQKQCKRKEIQGKHQAENLNAQSPESSSDVCTLSAIE